jgi:SAM-dependent methyltransferase
MEYRAEIYGRLNPGWHEQDSRWKAAHVLRTLRETNVGAHDYLEVGCGAGRVLAEIAVALPGATMRFRGIDVSADAVERARLSTTDPRVVFSVGTLSEETEPADLILLIDVLEHVPDYLGLLAHARAKAPYLLAHVPLEMNLWSVIRPQALSRSRLLVGHLHYFSLSTLHDTLETSGYQIISQRVTAGAAELPTRSLKRRLAALPRKGLARLSPPLAARTLGGFSALVLARRM